MAEILITAETKPEIKRPRTWEKVVYVSACVTMMVTSLGAVSYQWLIPYLYVTLTPVLVGLRIRMYWKNRWHYFLLDFCYYANIFCLLFLCIPGDEHVFSIVYSLSHGPLVWAVPIYWNSLVLHSLDKVTSTYIHILPPVLAFVVRWFPSETSIFWYQAFVPDMPPLSPIWMYVVPFFAFVFHGVLYALVVNVFWPPPEGVVSSYSYLGDKEGSFLYTLFNCLGPRFRCSMFYIWNWIFCLVALVGSVLCYYSFPINCVCLTFLVCVALWNGASYYVHVFSVRGFVDDIE